MRRPCFVKAALAAVISGVVLTGVVVPDVVLLLVVVEALRRARDDSSLTFAEALRTLSRLDLPAPEDPLLRLAIGWEPAGSPLAWSEGGHRKFLIKTPGLPVFLVHDGFHPKSTQYRTAVPQFS